MKKGDRVMYAGRPHIVVRVWRDKYKIVDVQYPTLYAIVRL